ncbi:hypothetical protein RI129_012574 [Pyrocoelia pectoralis]|uniref:Uncharacterized protein n=1 Tax=Pyrocoelia pectoralis TaxID=417401 RepID=A0AAN7V6L2_9COLE
MSKLVLVVLLLFIITCSHCARILGIIPSPSYSHQTTFQPLFRELSLRGHQVTTLTTEPINDPELVNLTEIDLHFSYDVWKAILSEAIGANIIKSVFVLLEAVQEISRLQLEHPQVQDLLRNKTAMFDLVILEYTIPAMMPFAQRFNCPFIGIVPMDPSGIILQLFGHPTHKVLYPDNMLSFTDHQTFFELIQSVIFTSIIEFHYTYYFYPNQQKLVNWYFGENYPSLEELAANVSLLFINSYTVFHKVRPLLPNVIPVGGVHRRPSKPLPKVTVGPST